MCAPYPFAALRDSPLRGEKPISPCGEIALARPLGELEAEHQLAEVDGADIASFEVESQ